MLSNLTQNWLHKYSPSWCQQNFIHLKAMRKVREVRQQLREIMESKKLKLKINILFLTIDSQIYLILG